MTWIELHRATFENKKPMPRAVRHYEPHPAKGVLAMRRITIRHLARGLDMHEIVVGRMLNGLEPASPRFRAGLSALLDLRERVLYRDGSTR